MPEPSRQEWRGCPVRWSGRQAIAVLPRHVGQANARRVREDLLTAIGRGAAVLIVDMTATLSCDHPAADVLARVYQRAVASGTELRLVIGAPAVRRVVALSGLDQLVPVFPALKAAQGGVPSSLAAVLPLPRRAADLRGSEHPGRESMPGREPEDALSRIASDIFRAGLTLQEARDLPAGALRRAAEEVLDLLDFTARDARTAVFAGLDCSTGGPIGAGRTAEVVRPGADAWSGLLRAMGEDNVRQSRQLVLLAAQTRARSRQARARTIELATRAAATQDRVATSLSRAAASNPRDAHGLRTRSEAAAGHATRMRQWAAGHA